MVKVGILICNRNRKCAGGKCFMSIYNRDGAFKDYPKDEPIEVVGFIPCGGCPGERLEHSPADMKKYGADVIHLASCFLAGYPPCPYIENFKQYIEEIVGLPVVVGSHPMPQNYVDNHSKTGDWTSHEENLKHITKDPEAALKYDSTLPSFLKKK
jgi:predicted metal-binding protein